MHKISSWVPGIFGKIHNLALRSKNEFVLSLIVKTTIQLFFWKLRSKVNGKNLNIIFPTACPFAVSAVYHLEKSKIIANIFVRVTNTSERRTILGEMYPLKNLITDAQMFKSLKVNFGFETQTYLEKSGFLGLPNVYISKFAVGKKGGELAPKSDKLVVSFLGYPTKDKGHDLIFPIIKGVTRIQPELNWQVQLYENDVIEDSLTNLNVNLEILRGKISQETLELALRNSSLLILPYNPIAFQYNASAMMYHASDYCIPLIALEGSAFASEVEEFQIGKICKNVDEIIEVVQSISFSKIELWKKNFAQYNYFRNNSNVVFLKIDQHNLPS
jgi:hypothetical protein